MAKQPEGKLSTKIMKVIRNNGGFAYKVWGNEMQMAGVPDVSAVYQGYSMWCETKMPGNKPSMIQKLRINQIRTAGGLVVVGYSLQDVCDMIDHIDTNECTHELNECLYRRLFDLTE